MSAGETVPTATTKATAKAVTALLPPANAGRDVPPGRPDPYCLPAPPGAVGVYAPEAFAAFAAAFISCLCALTLTRDSGPVMSATERKDFGSP
ncbi:hypothetical protein QFZ49_003836 [Streptomyces turgidiscabies]|uniref:Uncharacterized protein n=1 Tax=Streptomyces turgidiscabies TaxID=85558 RepID=A0ABU0RPH6_9ACTN|nr:hypothetical protein [Streptomyces turgidiscabies]